MRLTGVARIADGGDGLTVGTFATAPATVVIDQDDTVVGLSVVANVLGTESTLRIGAGAVVSRVPPFIDLGANLSGTIDLAGGSLLWRAGGSTPDFRTLLIRGRNNGAWNGTNSAGAG